MTGRERWEMQQLVGSVCVTLVLAGALPGCSGDSIGAANCQQGDTRECVGPGACQGTQQCTEQGTWSDCDCGSGDEGDPTLEACVDAVATGSDPLIDDLNDDDGSIPRVDGRIGVWYVYNDGTGPQVPEAANHETAAECIATMDEWRPPLGDGQACSTGGPFTTWGGAIAVGLNDLNCRGCDYDASIYDGVRFTISGEVTGRLILFVRTGDTTASTWGGDCGNDDCTDGHNVELQVSSSPQVIEVSWDDLAQEGWGVDVAFNIRKLRALQWQVMPTTEDASFTDLCIDDVEFF